MDPKIMKKFFDLQSKATAELQEEIDEELKTPDPSLAKAKAILEESDDSPN